MEKRDIHGRYTADSLKPFLRTSGLHQTAHFAAFAKYPLFDRVAGETTLRPSNQAGNPSGNRPGNRFRHIGRLAVAFLLALIPFFTAGSAVADEAQDMIDKGVANYNAAQYGVAVSDFTTFLARYPQHERNVEAAYLLAESYLRLQDYVNAGVNYKRVIDAGLGNSYARFALFRIGEIPWLNERYDLAKPYLIDFMMKLPRDVNNRFVLYYLGDIAMHDNAPGEAEYYFENAIKFDAELMISPKGEKVAVSQLGLAWAKNRLGKYAESDNLYRLLTMSGNPPAEEACARWGIAQYDRGAYNEAASTLSGYVQRYPLGPFRSLVQETLGKTYIELKRNTEALAALQQVVPKTDTSRIQECRVLFALKRVAEGEMLLQELDRTAATQYRDMITALKMYLAADQDDWGKYVSIGESFLGVRYDTAAQRVSFQYYDLPSIGDAEKLTQDNFLRICGGLAIAYAKLGNTNKSQATYSAMLVTARGGDPVLAEIVSKTDALLSKILPNQPFEGGNDAAQLRAAIQKYMSHDYAGTIAILTPLLGVQYVPDTLMRPSNQPANHMSGGTMSFTYVPNTAVPDTTAGPNANSAASNSAASNSAASNNGKLSLDSMVEACQVLVLSYAYGGDAARANAGFAAMRNLCNDVGNTFQQGLLAQTRYRLDSIPAGGGASGIANGIANGITNGMPNGVVPGASPGPGTPINPSDPLNPSQPGYPGQVASQTEREQRRVLADCRSLYRRGRGAPAETPAPATGVRRGGCRCGFSARRDADGTAT